MQKNKLFIGNLNFSATSDQLRDHVAEYGEVISAKVIQDKGFGFVELASDEDAEKVKNELDGTEFAGRSLRIDFAKPPKPREARSF